MSNIVETIKADLNAAIENDKLVLPTLPEVALQVRDIAQSEDSSIADLVKVISNDTALSARVIRVTNSPLFRGSRAIENLNMAVSRLGMAYTSNLAMGLAMEQMFQATNDAIDRRMRACWSHATEIAASAQVLARHFTKLPPDQALLAGLVHQIGTLPLLSYAEQSGSLIHGGPSLDHAIAELHQELGQKVLQSWDFPPELIAVTTDYLNFERERYEPDLIDLIQVATLQSYAGTNHPLANTDTSQVGAFVRLGLAADTETLELDDIATEQSETQAALSSGF